MAHEAFIIALLCVAVSIKAFDDDRPIFGVIWVVLCAAWVILGICRALG